MNDQPSDVDPFWLLRVPVRQGDPVPLELWLMWHAGTLIPMQRTEKQQQRQEAA